MSPGLLNCVAILFGFAFLGRPAGADVADFATTAVPATDFLNSIGACVHIQHHQDASKLVEPLKYTGIRAIRDGADTNFDMSGLLLLHRQAGMMVCFGPGSGALLSDNSTCQDSGRLQAAFVSRRTPGD